MAVLRFLERIGDFFLTVLLWAYFLFGYLFLLLFLFVPTRLRLKDSAAALQKMNFLHLNIFFAWLHLLAPRARFAVDENVRRLRSSIIVCNHVSYLDPILLVSLFERQTTIVKNTFFRVPIFGWFLKKAGYVPSPSSEIFDPAMAANLENIKSHLDSGGNLFVFPEGTRSRGRLLPFNKGVFSIARYCRTGVKLVFLENTDALFPPGSFSFRMGARTTVSAQLLGSLEPDYAAPDFSLAVTAEEARRIFQQKIAAAK
jgi:1-acyl-sn-glycerol-3-phosphate acyltransferase